MTVVLRPDYSNPWRRARDETKDFLGTPAFVLLVSVFTALAAGASDYLLRRLQLGGWSRVGIFLATDVVALAVLGLLLLLWNRLAAPGRTQRDADRDTEIQRRNRGELPVS